MRIIIAGGGIGGLTLALMLHQRNILSQIYEAAPTVKPLGVRHKPAAPLDPRTGSAGPVAPPG